MGREKTDLEVRHVFEWRMNNPIAVSVAAGLTGLALWSGTATAPSPTDGPDAAYRILVQEDEEFRWSGAMQPGATLEIRGRVRGADRGGQVVVTDRTTLWRKAVFLPVGENAEVADHAFSVG